jgi:hypothetical protein
MEELEIQLNVEQELRIWKKYLRFERNKDKSGYWHYGIGMAFGLIFALLGMGLSSVVLLFTGVIVMIGSALVIALYFIRFRRFEDKSIQYLTDAIKTDPLIYFSFDETSVRIRTTNTEAIFQWSRTVRFNENEGDLYLYDGTNQIWNIISVEKIGADNYQHFRALLDIEMQSKIKGGRFTSS